MRRIAASLVAFALAACSGSDSEPDIGRVSAFHLGGREIPVEGSGVDAEGSDETFVGQVAVTALLPNVATERPPIVMLPGFGIAVTSYLETADGREGWDDVVKSLAQIHVGDATGRGMIAVQNEDTVVGVQALPDIGICGNSHLMMDELNSAELLAMMLDWLEKNL